MAGCLFQNDVLLSLGFICRLNKISFFLCLIFILVIIGKAHTNKDFVAFFLKTSEYKLAVLNTQTKWSQSTILVTALVKRVHSVQFLFVNDVYSESFSYNIKVNEVLFVFVQIGFLFYFIKVVFCICSHLENTNSSYSVR